MLPKADAVAHAWALPDELTLRQASSTLARLLGALKAQPQGQGVRIDAGSFAVDGLPAALGGLAALYGVQALLNAPA